MQLGRLFGNSSSADPLPARVEFLQLLDHKRLSPLPIAPDRIVNHPYRLHGLAITSKILGGNLPQIVRRVCPRQILSPLMPRHQLPPHHILRPSPPARKKHGHIKATYSPDSKLNQRLLPVPPTSYLLNSSPRCGNALQRRPASYSSQAFKFGHQNRCRKKSSSNTCQ